MCLFGGERFSNLRCRPFNYVLISKDTLERDRVTPSQSMSGTSAPCHTKSRQAYNFEYPADHSNCVLVLPVEDEVGKLQKVLQKLD